MDKFTHKVLRALPDQVNKTPPPNARPPRGTKVTCSGCREVVYDQCHVLKNHTVIRLDDGRFRWTSRDFDVVVHECDPAAGVVAQAEAILSADN